MKERPIIFSTEMVRATLERRKTQTRRVIKPQPPADAYDIFWWDHGQYPKEQCADDGLYYWCNRGLVYAGAKYGTIGDRLWVKETFSYTSIGSAVTNQILYKATDDFSGPWRPSIFMPHWASRITLEIVDIKAEKLQDITEEDAIAEGVNYLFSDEDCQRVVGLIGTSPKDHGYKNYLWHGELGQKETWPYQFSNYPTAKGSYSSLWEKINAKIGHPWSNNDWVLAISFKMIEDHNENQ